MKLDYMISNGIAHYKVTDYYIYSIITIVQQEYRTIYHFVCYK